MPWVAAGHTTRELRDGDLVVGGSAEAMWRITTAELLPRHFVLAVHGGQASVRAFNTDSVVVVNGEQLSSAAHALRDGDVIAAGSARFVYSDTAPAAQPHPTPPRAEPTAYLVDTQTKTAYRLAERTGIGRDASNAIVVRDPTASRFHAEIRREAGGFAVHPRGSAGTLVNDRRVGTPCLLEDGDRIEIAYRVLRFTTSPLGPDETVAQPGATAADELSRRPTIPRDYTPRSQGLIDASSSRSRSGAIGVVVVVGAGLALLAWALMR